MAPIGGIHSHDADRLRSRMPISSIFARRRFWTSGGGSDCGEPRGSHN